MVRVSVEGPFGVLDPDLRYDHDGPRTGGIQWNESIMLAIPD